jgi:hypothetical protein
MTASGNVEVASDNAEMSAHGTEGEWWSVWSKREDVRHDLTPVTHAGSVLVTLSGPRNSNLKK